VNDRRGKRSLDCQHEQMIKIAHTRICIHGEFVSGFNESSLHAKLSHDDHLKTSFRHVDVIPVRVKKEVAYVFPGTLFPGPWPEELNRKTMGLGPATRVLQSLIESPPEILSSFVIQDRPSVGRTIRSSSFELGHVPLSFPKIESETADAININRTSNFVMAEDPGFEEHSNSVSAATCYLESESIEYAVQLMRKFRRYQRVDWRRIDSKIPAGTNRFSRS
jgi:hypothetical protein